VIENRGGAGGSIATRQIAKAAPDGYTLGLGGTGTLAINPTLYGSVGYDPRKDFAPIGLIATSALVVCVHPSLPVRSIGELIALAKREAGKLNYASAGTGSGIHLGTEYFATMAGIKLTHIPYKGASQAMTDLLGGHLPAASMTLTSAAAQLDAKKLRALAISSPRRVTDFPDIATYAEQGFADIVAYTWFGISGPANMPPAIARKLNAEVIKALRQPDAQERLRREAIYSEPFTPQEFTAFFEREIDRWAPLAKQSSMQER
jgi:tripartite-type tricarboxylate transporter receptor subunit TctC